MKYSSSVLVSSRTPALATAHPLSYFRGSCAVLLIRVLERTLSTSGGISTTLICSKRTTDVILVLLHVCLVCNTIGQYIRARTSEQKRENA